MRERKIVNKTIRKTAEKSFDFDRMRSVAQSVVKQAKKMGASAVEVDGVVGSGFSVTVRNGKTESIGHNDGRELGVTVYFGKRVGSAMTSDYSASSVRKTIEKACYVAKFICKDPFVGLADSRLMAYDYQDLDLFYPWDISIEQAITKAKECETIGFKQDKRIKNSEGSSVNSEQAFGIYANSHGFVGTTASTNHSFGVALIAEHKRNMQQDLYYSIARDPNDLLDVSFVAKKAAERTVRRLNPVRITTRECPVMFAADISRSLINTLIAAINGGNIYRKSSFLCDSINKRVITKQISIVEDPHIPKGLSSAAFDGEGVKTKRNNIITDGVLQHYILDSYTARKLKMKTTGNAGGTHNLIVKTSDNDFESLLKMMGTGLLVTDLLGDGVNIITGNYSRGIFGFWVEKGVIKHPVTGVTIAGNLKDMLLNIVAVGNDVDYRSSTLVGSILLEKMVIAGA